MPPFGLKRSHQYAIRQASPADFSYLLVGSHAKWRTSRLGMNSAQLTGTDQDGASLVADGLQVVSGAFLNVNRIVGFSVVCDRLKRRRSTLTSRHILSTVRVMRDGTPVPGTTPPAVLSQLTYRIFGPLRPDQVQTLLDYHGLTGRPAETKLAVARRHGITLPTLTRWSRTLVQAGSRLPLTPELAAEIARRTRPGEDHLARTRIASTLGLAAPAGVPPSRTARLAQVDQAAAAIAVRVLSTVGPLPPHILHHAIARARRFRPLPPITNEQLAAALTDVGATYDDQGQWHAPADGRAPDRYQALVAVVGGRDLTRAEMVDALVTAGYALMSAHGRKINTHPLIQHCGANRYRVLGVGP